MPAPTYEEPWWRHPHLTRTRCTACGKVVFRDEEHAAEHVERIVGHGGPRMHIYRGKQCGHWHLSRHKGRRRKGRRSTPQPPPRLQWGRWSRTLTEPDQ